MDVQEYIEAAVILIASTALMNILLTFIQLAVEELKKYSIMDGEQREKRKTTSLFRKNKTYAVLRTADRTA